MRILLTCATGFIGSAFLRQALAARHSVAGLVRSERAKAIGIRDAAERLPTRLVGTLEKPPWHEIEAFAPEACVHTAWVSTPGVYLDSPENHRFVEWSLAFLKRLAELGTQHILVLGTCIEYRMTGAARSEDRTPLEPTTLYARCKHELRLKLQEELTRHTAALCWGRVFYPYGPGEHPARLCTSIIQNLRRNQPLDLKTPDSRKDYIYIDDLARALVILIERKFAGSVNLGVGEAVAVRQIAQVLGRLLGKPELIRFPPEPVSDPLDCVVADSAKLRALGWRPEVDLEAGLRNLAACSQ
jgi:dTDP-6-deoxy-L-talose 4-dehydrogenase (NAD+)